jgi:hypothetical protein
MVGAEVLGHRPDKELIDAVVQMKQPNPTWGCPRIAQQMALTFDIFIDKTLFSEFSPAIIGRDTTLVARPGWPSLAT